jgi:hypothetical protein
MTTTGMDAFEMSEDQTHEEPPEGGDEKWGALRLIGLVALVAAFSGFVYLAYMQGVRNGAVGTPPVLTAESGPYKLAPQDPGGKAVENLDKKVYDLAKGAPLAGATSKMAPSAEPSISPAHSNAVPERVVDGATGALVVADNANGTPVTPTERPASIASAASKWAPGPQGGPISSATVQSPRKMPDTAPIKSAQSSTAPTSLITPPVPTVATPEPSAPLVTDRPAPSVAPPAANANIGAFLVQIASYRDQASAAEAWHKLGAKHSDLVSSLTPDFQTADVPGKGTYYRLRLGPFATQADAIAMCSALKARKQECLVVKN